jgi:L-alanine-DL-glutamate epimerase-like enolase superfamily enzyme
VEFLEQPVKAAATDELRDLPAAVRARIAADESLLVPADALRLAASPRPGIFNIKLMKCGGVRPGRAIAAIAEAAGISLMWGCMDESCISITAALHAALASPATRYLDLDGSFDLARDVAEGGFLVEDGALRPTGGPGLGVNLKML